MEPDLPRVLVVCDGSEQRQKLGALLYELLIDVHWQLQLDGLAGFAHWCQPQAVVLAMRDVQDSLKAYEALQPLLRTAKVRVGLLGVPQDGAAFPSRERVQLDCYLTPPATLHELAWLVTRSATDASSVDHNSSATSPRGKPRTTLHRGR